MAIRISLLLAFVVGSAIALNASAAPARGGGPCCGACCAAAPAAQVDAPAPQPPGKAAPSPAAPAGPAPAVAPPPRMGRGPMGEQMQVFHALLDDHQKIKRNVEETANGVVSTTTSDDLAVTEKIRTHVRQMKDLIESGRPIRMWDPLFVEIVKNHAKIRMEIEDIPGGARVRETSDDPKVVALIQAHARAVSKFVAEGWKKVHDENPVPAAYTEAPKSPTPPPARGQGRGAGRRRGVGAF